MCLRSGHTALMASEVAAFKGSLNNLFGLNGFFVFLLFRGTTHFN